MTSPMPLQSEPTELKQEKILSAKPKRPVKAVCEKVKDVVTSGVNCRKVQKAVVEQAFSYRRVGAATAKNVDVSFKKKQKRKSFVENSVNKAYIQEKKAKKIAYKRGSDEITLDELFMKQNGENHG